MFGRLVLGNDRGFTLVEVMAVIVMIGLGIYLTTMILTEAPPRYRLDSAAKQVGAMFRQARSRAISTGRPFILDVSSSNRLVRIYPGSSSGGPGALSHSSDPSTTRVGAGDPDSETPVMRYSLPSGVRIQNVSERGNDQPGDQQKIRISSSGQVQSYAIRLTGENGTEVTVVPNPATGIVQYQNDDKEQSMVIKDNRPPPG